MNSKLKNTAFYTAAFALCVGGIYGVMRATRHEAANALVDALQELKTTLKDIPEEAIQSKYKVELGRWKHNGYEGIYLANVANASDLPPSHKADNCIAIETNINHGPSLLNFSVITAVASANLGRMDITSYWCRRPDKSYELVRFQGGGKTYDPD